MSFLICLHPYLYMAINPASWNKFSDVCRCNIAPLFLEMFSPLTYWRVVQCKLHLLDYNVCVSPSPPPPVCPGPGRSFSTCSPGAPTHAWSVLSWVPVWIFFCLSSVFPLVSWWLRYAGSVHRTLKINSPLQMLIMIIIVSNLRINHINQYYWYVNNDDVKKLYYHSAEVSCQPRQ